MWETVGVEAPSDAPALGRSPRPSTIKGRPGDASVGSLCPLCGSSDTTFWSALPKSPVRTSLVVQCLRLCSQWRGRDWIPGGGTMSLYARGEGRMSLVSSAPQPRAEPAGWRGAPGQHHQTPEIPLWWLSGLWGAQNAEALLSSPFSGFLRKGAGDPHFTGTGDRAPGRKVALSDSRVLENVGIEAA